MSGAKIAVGRTTVIAAATGAPASSSGTAASAGRANCQDGRKNRTHPTARSALRDRRLEGNGVHHVMSGIARVHILTLRLMGEQRGR